MAEVQYSRESDQIDTWNSDMQQGMARLQLAEARKAEMEQSDPSALDTMTAAYSLYNPITSYIVNEPLPDVLPVAGYNPFEKGESGLSDIDGYERYWQAFLESNNPETTATLKSRIDREMRNREVMANSSGPLSIAATVAAALSDPFNLALMAVPGGALVKAGQVGKSALRSGAAGVAAVAGSEAVLYGTQETREMDESLINLAATAAIDSLIGAGVSKYITPNDYAKFERSVKEHFTGELDARHASAAQAQVGASGSRIQRATAAFRYTGLETLGKWMMNATPLGRTLLSDSRTTRKLAQELAENAVHLEVEGGEAAVETLIKLDMRRGDKDISEVRTLQSESGLSGEDFSQQLTMAQRRGDISENEHVQRAAQILRKTTNDLWEKAAELRIEGAYIDYVKYIDDAGVEKKVPLDSIKNPHVKKSLMAKGEIVSEPIRTTTAESYLRRMYDLGKVRADAPGFRAAWRRALTQKILTDQEAGRDAIEAAIAKGASKKEIRALEKEIPAMPDEERWGEMLIDIYEKVSNLRKGDIHANAGPGGGAMFKKRVQVDDEFLEEYLVKDWETLYQSTVKNLSSRIRLAERFGEGDGDFMMANQLRQLDEEYGALRTAAEEAGDASAAKRLSEQHNKNRRDIEFLRDSLLGTTRGNQYADPDNHMLTSMLRTMRGMNVASKLNSVVIASIPDAARIMTYNGGEAFVGSLSKALEALPLSKMPKDEQQLIASISERVSHQRLSMYSDVDDATPLTKGERYTNWVSDKAMTMSGMKHWNSTWKAVVGGMANHRIVKSIRDGKDATWLKRVGIDGDVADTVVSNVKKHSTYEKGVWNMNVDRWDSQAAVDAVEAAVIKEADRVVLTPSVGDKPIFMSTEAGKSIFQFKSFIIAAVNKLMVPMMQEQGARKWAEIYTLMSLGALGYYTSQFAVGREPSKDPAVILREAIDRTGMAAYALELYNMANKVAGNPFGDDPTRYRSRNTLGALLGPSFGMATNLLKIPHSGTSADSRVHALRQMTPLQNHFLLRRTVFDPVEGAAARSLGGTGKYSKPKDRGGAVETPIGF